MALFFSKRRTGPREGDEPGELNIVPYLDILMNLIIFVLLSMTGLAAFGAVNVTAQTRARAALERGDAEPLRVTISEQGYTVARGAFVLTLPKKPDGAF